MEAKTGRGCRGPSLVDQVHELVARADLATLLDGVASAPGDFFGPMIVDHLVKRLNGEIAAGDAGLSPAAIEARRRNLLDLIATYEHNGYPDDDEHLVGLRNELAECDTVLDRLISGARP